MTAPESKDEAAVRALADAAGLSLTTDRVAAIAPILGAWLPASLELNRKMSAPEHRPRVPVTVLAHAAGDASE